MPLPLPLRLAIEIVPGLVYLLAQLAALLGGQARRGAVALFITTPFFQSRTLALRCVRTRPDLAAASGRLGVRRRQRQQQRGQAQP